MKNAVVIITNNGNSFFIVLSFTFIGLVMADNPIIKRIFTMQEPITFARVISLAPDLILLNDIASSGAQVPKAAIVKAINILGTLSERDKLLAALTNISENLINIVKPNISNIIVVNIKLNFYSSLFCPFQSILVFLKLLLLEEIIKISIELLLKVLGLNLKGEIGNYFLLQ